MRKDVPSRLRRALRWPPLHFALVGGLLFVGEATLRGGGPGIGAERPRVEVTDRRVRALAAQHERRAGTSADPATVRVLVDRFVEDEILYREALRRGLASDNPAVLGRLRQKLEFLNEGPANGLEDEAVLREAVALGLADEDVVLRNMFVRNMRLLLAREADRPPTQEELESYLRRHAEDFREPARVTWHHALISRSRRGERLRPDAEVLLEHLRSAGSTPETAAGLGDPFVGGHAFRGTARRQVAARFGTSFADAVLALPEGEWSDPIPSPFGLHLVRVERHAPERIPALEEVRDRVTLAWRRELRDAHLAQALAALRARYEVVVEYGALPGERSG
jgi:hypothetical protein